MDVFTTSLRFADVLPKGLRLVLRDVLPRLMSQLMVFSCLISFALSVSVFSLATGRALAELWAVGTLGARRPLRNERRGGGTNLRTLRPNASGHYFNTAVMPCDIM